MKYSLIFIIAFMAGSAQAQLIEGDLVTSGRKIKGEPKYLIEGMKDGWAKYDLSVDINGVVTGVQLVDSDLKSTPATTLIRNHVKQFTFEPGTHYPKYHHVTVKITMMKGKIEDPQINID